ncbi:MAG: hypothetical protein ACYC6W_10900 [Nitrosotalea sp.]
MTEKTEKEQPHQYPCGICNIELQYKKKLPDIRLAICDPCNANITNSNADYEIIQEIKHGLKPLKQRILANCKNALLEVEKAYDDLKIYKNEYKLTDKQRDELYSLGTSEHRIDLVRFCNIKKCLNTMIERIKKE